jgi:hypothetical protein
LIDSWKDKRKEEYIAGQKDKQTNGAFMIETFKLPKDLLEFKNQLNAPAVRGTESRRKKNCNISGILQKK